ncbi:chemotaxis-specific protein-glutamate methyltransferase CheB [Pseudooceanicola sp. CBS1P-1]|uniref:Protein-glutamate methylesterase/protein-glutamine glutaminase n=1 Tax=Pseudooceanicola albus TaxID=2692189 RepID=A0A6L7GA83_9RHOB|nr:MULTISPECIES: chemotaxis-specific protein-glutamate methyltransferase CheB [Pseudooceanicola]MBT9382846.1 chemotaxis-specific protein-glutamate methyltransferase CheB [Pseudooceanicola endophyticus]MXN20230.1 chemotaxis-specific protein-glutamate methyltransferase CheB [Pseudooceanicola albus]
MKLLIVDDSALMRRVLQQCFAEDPEIELMTARDGEDALEKAREFQPDVITLDINMPKMDGLTCLAHLTEDCDAKVIMVSSLTEKGALATFEALELGAVDFVAKPGGTVSLNLDRVFDELRAKVRAAMGMRPVRRAPAPPPPRPRPAAAPPPRRALRRHAPADVLLIGSSTGGPKTVGAILEALPVDFPIPIVVAQHMPERFTRIFSQRLNDSCALRVTEVTSAQLLEPGTAYIATGGADLELRPRGMGLAVHPVAADDRYVWHPSVSRLVASALDHVAADRMLAVMLTGMGNDGAAEMAALHDGGGRTIAESAETAAVFGMPEQLIARDGATKVLPSYRIADQILRWSQTAAERTP